MKNLTALGVYLLNLPWRLAAYLIFRFGWHNDN